MTKFRTILYFNSIKVRLELDVPPLFPVVLNVFQFHKGTIRTNGRIREDRQILQFQFHKGTIRTEWWLYWLNAFSYFNSIKVRLEPQGRWTRLTRNSFQFHKGTIRTPKGGQALTTWVLFQFHKGTIRTVLGLVVLLASLTYFNSIKVRLEQLKSDEVALLTEFQFHKGTIRTQRWPDLQGQKNSFQFHKGTIRTILWQM